MGKRQTGMLDDAKSNSKPQGNFLHRGGLGKVNNIKFPFLKDYSGCSVQNGWEGRQDGRHGS